MHESRADTAPLHSSVNPSRLLGDIGGTNARFGWQAGPLAPITHIAVLPCAEQPSLEAAVRHYLKEQGLAMPGCAAFGIATPVAGDQVRMTNHHWAFSISTLRAQLGLARLLVLNDFTALALALQGLPPEHLVQIGAGSAVVGGAIALIGPGTGLGVSGLIPTGRAGGYTPITGEGGHVSLGATNATEFAVLDSLRQRYGHVSAERAVSGMGLPDLFHALCQVKSYPAREVTNAAQILQEALAQPTSPAAECLELFCAFLGDVAGDLALTLGAIGGVYIGGGIAPRMLDFLAASAFRSRFARKGRYSAYLAAIPTWVIDCPVSPALQGAANALALAAPP